MKYTYLHIIFAFVIATNVCQAQLDTIQQLPEVMLTDTKLLYFSKGYKVEKLNDSVIRKNNTSLTETLRYNSAIYFKENGFGMVSSPSFRGTNASQTAVVWNGININSVFTGQTDFNTLSPVNYDEISIRSGGGGVQYGSGAVGGSIHLNNGVSFKKLDTTQLDLFYGSFSTFGGDFKTKKANKKYYLDVGASVINSENDYDFPGKDLKNNHGEFLRFSSALNAATKFKNNLLSWNSSYSYNDRNFSGSLTTTGRDKYIDVNTRNLVKLENSSGLFKTTASAAHLFESFRYFPNSEKPLYSEGNANTFIGNLQTQILLNSKIRINGGLNYEYIDAVGDDVGENNRKTLAALFLLNHKISEKLSYGINIRKEFLNDFDNPWLFSADAKATILSWYAIRANVSKNYRIPTFNDLFWSSGGNLNLQPETSYQAELGQEFTFGNLQLDLAAYYISSKDLIKWVPGNNGIWSPTNINKTRNYGLEGKANYSFKFRKNNIIRTSLAYSYTKAEDMEKEKQLIYVPFYKATGTVEYGFKNSLIYVQSLYTGEVFTTTDNNYNLDSYTVFNAGVEYSFPTNPNIAIGGRLKNVFNVYYENVAYRPMPSRNIQIYLNLNI